MKIYVHFSTENLANVYVVSDNEGNGIIIDPAYIDRELVDIIENGDITIKAIFITHRHESHTAGVGTLMKIYPADSLTQFESTLNGLASTTSFSEKALRSVLTERNQMDEYTQVKEKLQNHGITIGATPLSPGVENLIRLQNKRDRNFSIPPYLTRLTYKPPRNPGDSGADE